MLLALLDKTYRTKWSLLSKSILAFTGIVFLADIFGQNPFKSIFSNYERMEGFVTILHLAMYYLSITTILNTEKIWDWFWKTSMFSSFIMSVYGILQVLGKIDINQGGVRVDGRLGNATYLAIYLVFHIFIGIYYILKNRQTKQKYIYLAVTILNTIVLYFTATRGAILGLFGGLFVTALLILLTEKQDEKLKKISKGIIGFVVLVVLAFFVFKDANFVKKSPVLSRFSSLSSAELKNQGRYFVWPMALKGFAEKPILGWGQENFNFVFNKYYNPAMYNQELWFDRTHNVFLDWLVAGGLLGLLSYASIYLALLYLLWKKTNLTQTEKSVLTGLLSAYVFHNIFVFDNLVSYIVFFSLAGFLHYKSLFSESVQVSDQTQVTKDINKDMYYYGILPLSMIVLIAMLYFFVVSPMQDAKNIIKGITPNKEGVEKNLEAFKEVFSKNSMGRPEAVEQLVTISVQLASSNNFNDKTKQEFLLLTKTELEKLTKRVPTDARYLLLYGAFLNKFSMFDDAIPVLEKAVEYSPKKPTMHFELGTSYIGKGNYQKAYEVFKTAYELEPRFQDSAIIYTIGAIYANKADVVSKMLTEVVPQNTFLNDNRFVQAFIALKNYNAAISILNERLKTDPKNISNLSVLAGLYNEAGNKTKAIEILREIIKINPQFKDQGEFYIKQLSQ
jgi:O-antigen ligase/Tfp pilus assembly protein PilF